jgi:exodeoxyribonuclease VII small subunit
LTGHETRAKDSRSGGDVAKSSDKLEVAAEASYDALVARLEKVVEALEAGDLSLEQSVERFAEGVKLARDAGSRLDEAERRVEQLVRDAAGNEIAVPLDVDEA